jgi:virginiamycin B lyase
MKANSRIGGPHGGIQTALLVSVVVLVCALPALAQGPAQNRHPVQLPDGAGKAVVEAACVQCHDLERVVRPIGNTPEGWQLVLNNMVGLGAKLNPDQVKVVHGYLAGNFPDKAPRPKLVPGPIEVTIKEWDVPKPGTRPHDPLVARDGSIWYAGINLSVLGRFDPKTTQIKEYPLKPKSGPHGLVDDKEGNIWFTAQQGHYIGKLDPKTGNVTEYKLSHPDARSPHTPILDQKGNLFFTTSGNDFVGRVNGKTGEVTMVKRESNPYGILVNSKGVPFFTLYETNKLGSINPDTMEIKEYVLPNAGIRPRRLAITSDDVIWYGDYDRGYLGSYDPKTGKHREWPSPSGPPSLIYGITVSNDVVWYNESGVRPNTIVRFDPKTEKFQSWAIPSGGGVVRHMMPDKNGNIWIAGSGVNKIGVVEVKQPATRTSSLQ